ncbi:MAG: hypothetical protein ACFCVD_23625 [Nodosilinea sp.]
MRRRADRQQDFDSIKTNLYAAGVSTVKAAKAQEEMFATTLEALAEAYETSGMNQLGAGADVPATDLRPILERLLAEKQAALEQGNYEAYVDAETKLQHLDELAVTRLERQVRLHIARQQLATLSQPHASAERWTESALKAQYKTLSQVKEEFRIKARSWQEAVKLINSVSR